MERCRSGFSDTSSTTAAATTAVDAAPALAAATRARIGTLAKALAAAAASAVLTAAPVLPAPAAAAAAAAVTAATASSASGTSSSATSAPLADRLLDPARLEAVYRSLPPPLPAAPLADATDADALPAPDIRRATLPNGLRVLLLEDREVPLVRGGLLLAGGQAASPAGKVGLASITAAVQRAGGSRAHPSEALDARLEDLAAAVEASAGPRALSIDFEVRAIPLSPRPSLFSTFFYYWRRGLFGAWFRIVPSLETHSHAPLTIHPPTHHHPHKHTT